MHGLHMTLHLIYDRSGKIGSVQCGCTMARTARKHRFLLAALVPIALYAAARSGTGLFASLPVQPEPLPAPHQTVLSRDPQLQGVASCASMACHHGNGPKGAWRSEYTTWVTYDPHK